MDAKHNVRSYDWFKFVVAVILALIALLLLLRAKKAPALSAAGAVASEAQAEIQAKLPKFPSAGFEWKYDAARGVLLNPEGRAVYRLDPDLGKWVPELPEDLRAKLPEGFRVGEVDGQWQITGPEGKALFRWNPKTLSWEGVEAPTVELPEFPAAGFEWKFDAAQGVLLNPEGRAVYRLDPDLGKWVPELPEDLRAKLPAGFRVGEVDGQWQITGPDGKVLFRWNPETLTWEAVEETSTAGTAEPTEAGDCAARPARLKVGDSAKVLTNLNLRSSPGIGENWLLTMPAGTVVEVIGGPECLPYGDGAYRWWQVRLPDGRTGWAAEAPIHGDSYFLEPVK